MFFDWFDMLIKIVLGACTLYPLAKFIYNKIITDIARKVVELLKHLNDS